MKRVHLIAAWLAIVALLIDGLLPTAVSAAAQPRRAAALARCGASGDSLPAHAPPAVPAQHCALCAVCAGGAVGLLPDRAEGLTARISAGTGLPAIARSRPLQTRPTVYPAAQPRAPPEFAS